MREFYHRWSILCVPSAARVTAGQQRERVAQLGRPDHLEIGVEAAQRGGQARP